MWSWMVAYLTIDTKDFIFNHTYKSGERTITYEYMCVHYIYIRIINICVYAPHEQYIYMRVCIRVRITMKQLGVHVYKLYCICTSIRTHMCFLSCVCVCLCAQA